MTREETQISKALAEALRDVFGENQATKRFIDVTRIPLICKSIIDTSEEIKKINQKLDDKYVTKEHLKGVVDKVELNRKILFAAIGFILLSFLGAIVGMVIIQ